MKIVTARKLCKILPELWKLWHCPLPLFLWKSPMVPCHENPSRSVGSWIFSCPIHYVKLQRYFQENDGNLPSKIIPGVFRDVYTGASTTSLVTLVSTVFFVCCWLESRFTRSQSTSHQAPTCFHAKVNNRAGKTRENPSGNEGCPTYSNIIVI